MQEYSQTTEFLKPYRFLLEHIGQAFLGEEVPITTAFNDYAIARCQRINGIIDHVVVKWDFRLYVPIICFDPSCHNGTIIKLLSLFIYGRAAEKIERKPPEPLKFSRPPEKMTGKELQFELETIHGLSREQVNQYKAMDARVAKVKEMRSLQNQVSSLQTKSESNE